MTAAALHPDVERLALLGWRLAPATRRGRAGCFAGYLDAATHDLDRLEAWSRRYAGCNWVVVPHGSGVWALDCDVPGAEHDGDGVAVLRGMCARHGRLPPRPHGRSGGGGHLLVFRDTGHPVRARSGWPQPGLDPKASRCSFTVSPSVHHRTGQPYRWLVAPWELAPPPAPSWLLAAVAPPPEPPRSPLPEVVSTERAWRRLRRALDGIADAQPGTRNDRLNRESFAVARHVAAGKLGEVEAVEALYAAARGAGLPHVEARATIRSGFASGLRCPVEARRDAR